MNTSMQAQSEMLGNLDTGVRKGSISKRYAALVAPLSGTLLVAVVLFVLMALSPSAQIALAAPDALPGAFSKLDPPNGEINVPTTLSLTWQTSTGAVKYTYCYDTQNDNSCTSPATWITTTATITTLTNLPQNTTFYWQVRAYNAEGFTPADAGTWWSFTTVPPPPAAFSKTSPANGATDVSLTPTLSWQTSTGATMYEYCYDTTNDTNCAGSWLTTTLTSASLSGLSTSQIYYWQVRAVNAGGTTPATGGWWSFTTVPPPPAAFNKTSPANGATQVSISPTLSWQTSVGAVTYEYCYDTTNDSNCTTWHSTTTTSAALTGLTPGATYYWQVRAVNPGGATYANTGTWWSFTTLPKPGAFSKTSPINNANKQDLALTLQWAASSNASYYEYCYDTTNDTTCSTSWLTTTATSAAISGLLRNTFYYWQVRAYNASGMTEANTGTWWSFKTAKLPDPFSKSTPLDGASNVPVRPTLTWQTSTDADGYKYCIHTSASCSSPASWVDAGKVLSVTLGVSLTTSTTYYWQVQAYNNVGSTDANSGVWWSFTTQPPPPGPFGKISPVDQAVLSSDTVLLKWEPSNGALYYEYCYDTSDDGVCTSPQVWHNVGDQTSFAFSGLSTDVTYYWQVRARNANDNPTLANGGDWWSFAALTPRPFNKMAPLDGSVGVSLTVTLAWSSSAYAAYYEYCIYSLDPGWCDSPFEWLAVQSQTSVIISGLEYETTYHWQVRAINNLGITQANSGNWWAFTTSTRPDQYEPDDIPEQAKYIFAGEPQSHNIAPATDIDWLIFHIPQASNVVLETSGESGDTRMWLYDENSPTTPIGFDDDSGEGLFSLIHRSCGTNPLPMGTYLVKIDEYGNDAEIPDYQVDLTVEPCAGPFGKLNPPDGEVGVPSSVTLVWNQSNNASAYEYCYFIEGNSCVDWVSTGVATSAGISGLQFGVTYVWQVRALGPGGYTYADDNQWWVFSTPDRYEPDNVWEEARLITSTVQIHSIAPISDVDWVKFTLEQDSEVVIETSGAYGDTRMWLFRSDQSLVEFDDNDGVDLFSMIHRRCSDGSNLPPGEYRVRIDENGNNQKIPNYALSLTVSTCPPPGAFTKNQPSQGATNVSLKPLLSWSSSTNASSYAYCLDTTDNNACDADHWVVVSSAVTQVQSRVLDLYTTYYWQVKAINSTGEIEADGVWWSFTTTDITPEILLVDDDNNAPDVLAAYESVLDALAEPYLLWDTHYSDHEPALEDLAAHKIVIWFTGVSFGGYAGPGSAGEASLGQWLDQGKCLLLSSQDYLYDRGLTTFGATYLGISSYGVDVGDYASITGQNLFSGLGSYALQYPFTDYSDELFPRVGAQSAFLGNNGRIGALSKDNFYLTSFWAFPLEAVYDPGNRNAMVQRFLDECRTSGRFGKSSPQNGVMVGTGLGLSWDSVNGATGYEYCVDTTDNDVCNTAWTDVMTNTHVYLSSVDIEDTYFWQVRARFSTGNPVEANAEAWWSFSGGYRTYTPLISVPPATVDLLAPTTGAQLLGNLVTQPQRRGNKPPLVAALQGQGFFQLLDLRRFIFAFARQIIRI